MKKYISLVLLFFITGALNAENEGQICRDSLALKQVQFVAFMFTDFRGTIKEVTVPIDFVAGCINNGIGFDGSSVPGYTRIINSDMLLQPDMNTIHAIPWITEDNKTARIICNVYSDNETPYPSDPRYVLQKALKEARDMGYDFYVGPELEFFLCENNPETKSPYGSSNPDSYFDATTSEHMAQFQCDLLQSLKIQNIQIERFHHEVAQRQYEVAMHYGDALTVADQLMITKQTIKTIAHRASLNATFMPKPFYGHNGSGMHIHFSLWDRTNNCNAFYDENGPEHLSKIARHFIAGVLAHIAELNAIFNPGINSYKRLVPGYEAPTNICWGTKNRSTLIRIPYTNEKQPLAVRAEIRSPDALCNPYLAFAALLQAGLQGIKDELPLAPSVSDNLYQLTEQERKDLNITTLPASLEHAISLFETSSLARDLLGDHLFNEFVKQTKKSVAEFATFVTDWELQTYF